MVLRAPRPGNGLAPLEIHRGLDCKKAFYHGLMACGSIWSCPICAAKIAERRRAELVSALDAARAQGLRVHFVTLTIPHGIGDDINALLSGLRDALKRMSCGKHAISKQLAGALRGYIRTLEVTHGANGWHPHYHLLVMTDRHITSRQLEAIYAPAWQRACRLAGLPIPSDRHGCTVQDGSQAAKYASKWGLEDEMTKAHMKKTRRKGCTPWGLLRAILDGDDQDYPPERATALFQIYANAFKGSRQLYWSRGLRASLGLDQEITDQALVDRPDDEKSLWLAELSTKDWKAIRRANAESAVLDAAESSQEELTAVLGQVTGGAYGVVVEDANTLDGMITIQADGTDCHFDLVNQSQIRVVVRGYTFHLPTGSVRASSSYDRDGQLAYQVEIELQDGEDPICLPVSESELMALSRRLQLL